MTPPKLQARMQRQRFLRPARPIRSLLRLVISGFMSTQTAQPRLSRSAMYSPVRLPASMAMQRTRFLSQSIMPGTSRRQKSLKLLAHSTLPALHPMHRHSLMPRFPHLRRGSRTALQPSAQTVLFRLASCPAMSMMSLRRISLALRRERLIGFLLLRAALR